MAFPSPCHSCEGILFSWFVTLRILGVSTKVCPSPFPSGLQPQEFLTATRPCSFQHSSEWPCKCSSRYMVSEVSAPSKQAFLSFSAFAHLQSLGWQAFVPQPQFFDRSKESHWFCSFVNSYKDESDDFQTLYGSELELEVWLWTITSTEYLHNSPSVNTGTTRDCRLVRWHTEHGLPVVLLPFSSCT